MARNLLTTLEIKNATKAKLRDGDGLWLHQGKTGNRYWVFIYIRNGRRREMGLGPYGAGTGHVSIVAARKKADEIREILGRGGDPFADMEERKAKVKPVMFGDFADQYVQDMKSKWRGAKTEVSWRRSIETHAKPLRKMVIAEIDTGAVLRCLRPLWDDKYESATKLRERIKMVLDSAKVHGLRTGDNPAEWKGHLDQILVARSKFQKSHHAAMPFADIPAFIKKLKGVNGTGSKALRFTILTAARSGEARGATWGEIDLNANVWTIPASRMKAGVEHRVPLSKASVALLRVMKEQSVSDLIFSGTSPKRPISDMTMAKALRAAGGKGYTVHGFRSAFRDWVAEDTDHQREVAEAALAHSIGDAVEQAYRRGDALTKRRKMMEEWAAFCQSRGAEA